MALYEGSCHCGNVRVRFSTSVAPADLPLRACQCSFCRRHSSVTATDPAGHVRLEVTDAKRLSRYTFGHRTCEFVVCMNCGNYVAAIMSSGERLLATLNIHCLFDRSLFRHVVTNVVYDTEPPEERRRRREERWTPAELQTG